MKKSILILTAIAAVTLTGCDMNSGGDYMTKRFTFITETTEDDDTDIYVTTFEYDSYGVKVKETKKKNGMPYQVTQNFEIEYNSNGEMIESATRVTTNPDGSTTTHNIVATYIYLNQRDREILYQVFDQSNPSAPVESRETEYDDEGNVTQYIYNNTATGEVVVRSDYRYFNGSHPTQTYRELRNGTETRYGMKLTAFDNYYGNNVGYEIWKNLPATGLWDETGAIKVEEKVEYKAVLDISNEWMIKRYDDEGNTTYSLYVSNKLELKTITVL